MKRPRHTNGLAVVIAALLLTGAASIGSALIPLHPLTQIAGTLATPFRAVGSAVTGWGRGIYRYAAEYDALRSRVSELEGQVAEMERENREAEQILRENLRLRSLLELRERRRDFVFESAYVTGRSATSWTSTLTVSKGSLHGVEAGQCVVTENGALVGVVREAGPNWSTVATVLDPDLAVSVRFYPAGDDGILQGDFNLLGAGKTRVGYVSNDAQLRIGDQVLTSGMGGQYPSGLVAGTVESFGYALSGTEQYAVLTPKADLDRLEEVFVIKEYSLVE